MYAVLIFLAVFHLVDSECHCLRDFECKHYAVIGVGLPCFYGCKPGWEGNRCDKIVYTTTTTVPCHCRYTRNCGTRRCYGCERGWTGLRCDRKSSTSTPPVPHNTSDSFVDAYGGYVALIAGFLVCLCCCCCLGIKGKKRQDRRNSTNADTRMTSHNQTWRTDTSADTLMNNWSPHAIYTGYENHNVAHPESVNLQTDSGPFTEPPPSYETVMSQSNNTSRDIDADPPPFSSVTNVKSNNASPSYSKPEASIT